MFAKFSTLQDYGVDKVFFLENNNVDASQRNVIFLARGEKAQAPIAIAGMLAENLAWRARCSYFCLYTPLFELAQALGTAILFKRSCLDLELSRTYMTGS